MPLITPGQYSRLAQAALYKYGRPVEVPDMFCVPDFKKFVGDFCSDKEFGRWKLTKWAQSQFTVEIVFFL